jgi:proline iminopeptidase
VKLHVTRCGEGPLLVCHPGGPGFGGPYLHDLGGLDRTRELLLVDPRGSGRTGTADRYLIEDYVADLEELRGDLELEAFDLLGHSHGGLVAASYAIAHPARVRKLVLVGTRAVSTAELDKASEAVVAGALAKVDPRTLHTPEGVAALWNEMAPAYFAQWNESYRPYACVDRLEPGPLQAIQTARPDLRDGLGGIEADTLVITGRDDFICGPATAEALAEGIAKAELVILDDAGHMPYLEQPDAFRIAVERFLSR